ncbi:hypothetical protein [Streptomyces europaeiscabiei]|uniref:hypothetical protein n=1 Tax=Streptomyces europaeiscabiei TaxID=146819 RepID=UPI002E118B69|nr:hypothetical protein OHB30_22065 [Streptomyces europaeiscabiei]
MTGVDEAPRRRAHGLLAVAGVFRRDHLVAHGMAVFEVVDEDGDFGIAGAQVCEVRVRVRVFVTHGAFSVARFGHRVRRGRQGSTRLGVSHDRASFDP